MPHLQSFELEGNSVPTLLLPRLSSLRMLKIYTGYWTTPELSQQIPPLVQHNRGLTCLHLSGCYMSANVDKDIASEIWNILRESADWHLTDINAKNSPALVAYIASYSGL